MKGVALWFLQLYKRWISPAFPPACRYVPSCSEYAMDAVERYGVVRGGGMAAWRVLRCHPFVEGGLDPVVKGPSHTESCQASLGWTGEAPVPTLVGPRAAVPTYKITSY